MNRILLVIPIFVILIGVGVGLAIQPHPSHSTNPYNFSLTHSRLLDTVYYQGYHLLKYENGTTVKVNDTIKQTQDQIQVIPKVIDSPKNNPLPQNNTVTVITKPVIDTLVLEQKVHALINHERAVNGLSVLSFDPNLASVAREHSKDMVARNYFSHTTPDGVTYYQRGDKAGYTMCGLNNNGYTSIPTNKSITIASYGSISENIEQAWLFASTLNGQPTDWESMDQIANDTVSDWMGSPGHRANILDKEHLFEGIGIAVSNDGKVLVTENLC